MFALLGLAEGRRVQALSVHPEAATGEREAGRAVGLLRQHGATAADALGVGAGAHPAEIILSQAKAWAAGLIVMGAFGHRGLQELFFGSCTRRLLRECPVAIFVHH